MSYIAQQPNGLFCRFSSITDMPTDWNMTAEDVAKLFMRWACEQAIQDAERAINRAHTFDDVLEDFKPDNNMTNTEWEAFLKDVGYADVKEGQSDAPNN